MKDKDYIQKHIMQRKEELIELEEFWQTFKDQNEKLKFYSGAVYSIQAEVSSQMAFLQRSINDHEKLLKSNKQEIEK
jgi:hypothetical protein